MKHLKFSLIIAATVAAAALVPLTALAGRPNPPGIRGTVTILEFTPGPGTNVIAVPPRIHVLDERGRDVADVLAVADGSVAHFDIPLKKAGTYVVWAYYPATESAPALAEVVRKQYTAVALRWPAR